MARRPSEWRGVCCAALMGVAWLQLGLAGDPFCCTAWKDDGDQCGSCWPSAKATRDNWCGQSEGRCSQCQKAWCDGSRSLESDERTPEPTREPEPAPTRRPTAKPTTAKPTTATTTTPKPTTATTTTATTITATTTTATAQQLLPPKKPPPPKPTEAPTAAPAPQKAKQDPADLAAGLADPADPAGPAAAKTNATAPSDSASAQYPALRSCKIRGCALFDAELPCQCNEACGQYEDCCEDYADACSEGLLTMRKLARPMSQSTVQSDEGFCCMAARSQSDPCGTCWPAAHAVVGSECGSSRALCEKGESEGGCGKTWCVEEAGSKQTEGSCAMYGCGSHARNQTCQSHARCQLYQNCCDDFEDHCSEQSRDKPMSCHAYGCGDFRAALPCQCNADCAEFGDCCEDFESACARGPASWLHTHQKPSDQKSSEVANASGPMNASNASMNISAKEALEETASDFVASSGLLDSATEAVSALGVRGLKGDKEVAGIGATKTFAPFCCMLLKTADVRSLDCGSCWPAARATPDSECGGSEAACEACGAPLWCEPTQSFGDADANMSRMMSEDPANPAFAIVSDAFVDKYLDSPVDSRGKPGALTLSTMLQTVAMASVASLVAATAVVALRRARAPRQRPPPHGASSRETRRFDLLEDESGLESAA